MAVPELGLRVTREMLQKQVAARFPAPERDSVLPALEALGTEGEALSARVQLAIVKLSGGRAAELPGLIGLAHTDYRDVLAAAEYRHEMAEGVAADEAVIAAARRRDLDDFRTWLAEADRA